MNDKGPKLSVIVVFYDMAREAERTLYSLGPTYQTCSDTWEVIAIDNGSNEPIGQACVGGNEWLRYRKHQTDSVSPVEALNIGLALARADYVAIMIDGARIASPGLLEWSLGALRSFENPLVCSLAWHLGPKPQNLSMLEGYCQEAEDALLADSGWVENGYELFAISSLAPSCQGWFGATSESNFLVTHRRNLESVGAFDERFQSPGGGLLNLDLYQRLCDLPDVQLVQLLGEGTFHQFHGGVASNAPKERHPWEAFHEEYKRIRGEPYRIPDREAYYLGHMPRQALPFVAKEP